MRYGLQACVFIRCLLYSCFLYSSQPLISEKQNSSNLQAHTRYVQALQAILVGVKVESVEFEVAKQQNSDQKYLRKGFLARRPNALGTVLICHGYTHSKHEAFFFKMLFQHFNVLAFDFRGHGELVEKGQFSTIGRDEVLDVLGAVKFIKSHKELVEKLLIGFGFSMGAVSLLQAQSQAPDSFSMLILDTPFDSSNDCMEKKIEQMLTVKMFGKPRQLPGKTVMMKMLYSDSMRPLVKRFFKWASGMDPYKVPTKFVSVIPIAGASKVTIPCMFISCVQDKSVEAVRVRRLYDAVACKFKRLWITKGVKHCGSCLSQPERYAFQVNSFISDVLHRNFIEPAKIIDEQVTIQAEAN